MFLYQNFVNTLINLIIQESNQKALCFVYILKVTMYSITISFILIKTL